MNQQAVDELHAQISQLRGDIERLKSSNESYITLANTAYEITEQRSAEVATLRAAAQQALEALKSSQDFVNASANAKLHHGWGNQLDDAEKAIAALQAALTKENKNG